MRRKLPKSLFDVNFPPLWRYGGRRFIAHALRVANKEGDSSHYSGGPAPHKGNRCQGCKNKLTLLWVLNLNDELIPDFVREGFAPATRLPFYICWQCVAAAYSINSDTHIKCYPFNGSIESCGEDESPYQDSPQELERRSIVLERIPTNIEALLNLADDVGMDEFDEPSELVLTKYAKKYHKRHFYSPDEPISQLGGRPREYQGGRDMVCPNQKCPASKLENPVPYYETQFLMKELAVIDWRDEPALEEHCFLLLYYVCGVCFSVSAMYSCT